MLGHEFGRILFKKDSVDAIFVQSMFAGEVGGWDRRQPISSIVGASGSGTG